MGREARASATEKDDFASPPSPMLGGC